MANGGYASEEEKPLAGNLYLGDQYLGTIRLETGPGDGTWQHLRELDGKTYGEVRRRFEALVRDDPDPAQRGDWAFEFICYPTTAPDDYHAFESWEAHILVRTVDSHLTNERFGQACWHVPTGCTPIADWGIFAQLARKGGPDAAPA